MIRIPITNTFIKDVKANAKLDCFLRSKEHNDMNMTYNEDIDIKVQSGNIIVTGKTDNPKMKTIIKIVSTAWINIPSKVQNNKGETKIYIPRNKIGKINAEFLVYMTMDVQKIWTNDFLDGWVLHFTLTDHWNTIKKGIS